MLHISDIARITKPIEWEPCERVPMKQYCSPPMTEAFAIETQHGTMTGQIGDRIMRGYTGDVYVISAANFARCYTLAK